MGVDVSEEPRQSWLSQMLSDLREGFSQLRWLDIVLIGVGAGVLMPFSFLQSSYLTFIAGIIPVGAGLLIGRRAKSFYGLHGLMTGFVGAVVSLIVLAVVLFLSPIGTNMSNQAISQGMSAEQAAPSALFMQFGGFTALSLLAFVTFGASTSGRAEERNRQARAVVDERGGRLERPNTVRTPDDIRGQSLPQFGSYVNNLFKKKGFTFKDYRFIDKDKHLDLWMEYENEPWHLRLSVADKVNPGTIESLMQDMKREGCRKGVVITSTEFTPGALKSAKGRQVVLIDGAALYEIAEG